MLDLLKLAAVTVRYVLFILALYALGLHGPPVAILSLAAFAYLLWKFGAFTEPERDPTNQEASRDP